MESTTDVKIIEADNGGHRYVLERIWNDKEPMVTVVTLYPSTSELVLMDTTTMLITNNVYKLGFGGYFSVNLFSKINLPDFPNKLGKKRNYKTATNKTNDEHIIECCKNAKQVILAYGSLPTKNKQVRKRVEQLLELLKEEKLMDKVVTLTTPESDDCCHPLAPKVRNQWNLKPHP